MTMLTNVMKFSETKGVEVYRDESELSDPELLTRVQGRSRRALEVLYERYAAKAMGLACKILRDRDLAQEVVLDAFWRVWERADQFQTGRGSFASWFFGIVRNLAIDELRRQELRPIPSEDAQLELALASDVTRENDVTEIVARKLNVERVQDALNALPPPQREVLELAYLQGLTREEISQQLAQPLGTIHTRARLGLEKLRVMLEPTQAVMV